MLGMFKYGDLSTKIRGMKGKMLTSYDYEQMMLKRNVNEVALYLKNNTYYKVFVPAYITAYTHVKGKVIGIHCIIILSSAHISTTICLSSHISL